MEEKEEEKVDCLIGSGKSNLGSFGGIVSWGGGLVPGTSDLQSFHSYHWVLGTSHTGRNPPA